MKARISNSKCHVFALWLLTVSTINAFSQTMITIPGDERQVVQYDIGSSTKYYNFDSFNDIGRQDEVMRRDSIKSKNDTWRTEVEFWLHGVGIIRGSTITDAKLIVTIGGTTHNAKIVALDSMQSMINAQNLWSSIGQSQTTYFSPIPYGTSNREYTSAALKTAVQNHVYNGKFKIGVMSLSENQNQTQTFISINLQVTYTLPPGKIVVTNSFGGGQVMVDGSSWSAPKENTWTGGTQHVLEAIDQEWPIGSGKQRTFDSAPDKGWWKKDVLNPNGTPITTSRSFIYTVTAGETSTLEAQFKSSLAISGTYTVQFGTIRDIEPGMTVNCAAGSKILVNGTFVANGKSNARITFTSPTQAMWQGIEFSGGGTGSVQYCNIEYASTPIKAINVENLLIYKDSIRNSNFYNGIDDAAMAFYNSWPKIWSVVITGTPDIYPSTNASWNGVRFAEGSRGEISSSTIQNCGRGNSIVVQGTSSPYILSNVIQNNYYHGIVLPGGSGPVLLQENSITNSVGSYAGIALDNAGAQLLNNVSTGNNVGLYLNNNAWIYSDINVPYASNTFSNNSYGITLYSNSRADLGYIDPIYLYGTCNKIENNTTYNVYMDGTTTLSAQGNYWTPLPPQGIFVAPGGNINYSCKMLTSIDCSQHECSGAMPRIAGEASMQMEDQDQLFRDARVALVQRNYTRAEELFTYLLNSSPTTSECIKALIGLYHVFYQSKEPRIMNYVLPLSANNDQIGTIASELLMAMYAGVGQYDNAITIGTRLRSMFPNTPVEERALLRLAGLSGYDSRYREVSRTALQELRTRFVGTVDQGVLVALGSLEPTSPLGTSRTVTTSEQLILSSYPNPFNPATQFRFQIHRAGHFSLRIYDVLGRVVATLLNDDKQPGVYLVTWNTSIEPSGVYFAKLEGNASYAIRKVVLVR